MEEYKTPLSKMLEYIDAQPQSVTTKIMRNKVVELLSEEVKLKPYEFIVSLDGEAVDIFKSGGSVNIQIKNPHGVGCYQVESLSLIKVLLSKIKKLKKPVMPSDSEIQLQVRKLIMESDGSFLDKGIQLFKMGFSSGSK
jgi:hypothetical protein